MSNKRPYSYVKSTAKTIDLIIERVMLYLNEADCFNGDGPSKDVLEYYRKEVRAAVSTVLNDRSIIFSLDTGDVNDKLDRLVDDWDRNQWPTERKIKVLEALWRSEEVAEALDHYLEQEVMREAVLLDD